MKTYIVTFFSHFGATRFKKELTKSGAMVQLKPVPRFLSSSCGTCAVVKADASPLPENTEEIEQIVELIESSSKANDYYIIYSSNEN